jgi:GxxExxY protein
VNEKPHLNLDLENQVGDQIVDAAILIHRTLGPGLLESAYKQVLTYELQNRGFRVENEVAVPVSYKEHVIQIGYRIDILVNNAVIIENKTVENLLPIHQAQLLTYLKLSGCKLGYLLNWNVVLMKYGIKRMVC